LRLFRQAAVEDSLQSHLKEKYWGNQNKIGVIRLLIEGCIVFANFLIPTTSVKILVVPSYASWEIRVCAEGGTAKIN